MRYLGGKRRIAQDIARIVNAARGPLPFWEPFCGGLGASRALAAGGPGLITDAFPPLISLYQAVRAGWDPPAALTREEWTAARSLPDSDPRKAFAGFGCSFGGTWFGGYTKPGTRQAHGRDLHEDPAGACRAALIRDLSALRECAIERLDFLDVEPRPLPCVIYCDPPYAGTTGYALAFDSARFWSRVQGWERVGVPCFVSEFGCPVPHRAVWSRAVSMKLGTGKPRVERLFRVYA